MHLPFDPFVFFLLCLSILLVTEMFYFKLANAYGILDKPNQRSSHTIPVIRGGGIIFVIALVLGEACTGFDHPFFIAGAVIIAWISFMDDIREQSPALRSSLQAVALLLVLYETRFFDYPAWLILVAFIIIVGTVNAFNFMDGINGITGIYAAVNTLTFIYINRFHTAFIAEYILVAVLAAIMVFLFFNYRVRARCFAGDVGSVTLAYAQIFLVLTLIQSTGNFAWVLMFTVFGIDSVITIIYRLRRRENIFKAHRTHLYQFLANERKVPHRLVSVGYGIAQMAINFLLILSTGVSEYLLIPVVVVITALVYLFVRYQVLLPFRKI